MSLEPIHILLILLALLIAYLLGRIQTKPQGEIPTDLIDLYRGIQDLPTRVLQTIQGSINPQKGKMAELLTYAELRYDYDRIVPLGWPIDFIGIKNNDRIDFIEVKSGDHSLLTEEEKHIKNLIQTGRVHFRLIRVREEEISQFVSAQEKSR
ncbi:MAG: Holliday junction resolvase-like protein [Candidatus Daviesbacteria bacterium]|nr:Holliday junction resolvase-like protein [Candidatus Daviesbacteria bacterium]